MPAIYQLQIPVKTRDCFVFVHYHTECIYMLDSFSQASFNPRKLQTASEGWHVAFFPPKIVSDRNSWMLFFQGNDTPIDQAD